MKRLDPQFPGDRKRALLGLLERKQRLRTRELEALLPVSPATLRRDLKALEREGQLVRVHGGVMHPAALRGEQPFMRRSGEARDAKQTIGRSAAALVPAGACIFVDAGTTCLEAGLAMRARGDLTLVTHSLELEQRLRGAPVRLILLGGEPKEVSRALVGELTLEWLERFHFDVALLGATGVDADGAGASALDEAAVKRAVLRRSSRNLLLADHAKWDRPAQVRYALWRQFAGWICDGGLAARHRQHVRTAGVQIIRADS